MVSTSNSSIALMHTKKAEEKKNIRGPDRNSCMQLSLAHLHIFSMQGKQYKKKMVIGNGVMIWFLTVWPPRKTASPATREGASDHCTCCFCFLFLFTCQQFAAFLLLACNCLAKYTRIRHGRDQSRSICVDNAGVHFYSTCPVDYDVSDLGVLATYILPVRSTMPNGLRTLLRKTISEQDAMQNIVIYVLMQFDWRKLAWTRQCSPF